MQVVVEETITPEQQKFNKFSELFYMPTEEREALGLLNWPMVYKKVGISEKKGSEWKRTLKKEKEQAKKDEEEAQESQWRNEDGSFNVGKYLAAQQEDIVKSLVKSATSGNSSVNAIKVVLDQLKEVVDASGKQLEISVEDKYRIATDLINDLRGEYKDTGNCPVCGFSQLFRGEIRVDKGRKQQEDGTVEPVVVPF